MSTGQNRPTLQEIADLAHELGLQFHGGEQDTAFDLERHEPKLEGTYPNTQVGIDTAYGDLQRYRLLLQQMGLETSSSGQRPGEAAAHIVDE